ncbi:SemiSWEET family sugar transporter [Propionibacteriaceae bacterium G57]|uniref:SemiSWEET family sugar transporter n=1 Tax=Aestuariimicrobium sp. G57 TaxID=3418485 RepID=UPI003DA750E6
MIDVLGWAAAVAGATLSLPQLVRLIRSKVSAGLSLLMWQLLVSAGFGWTVHGLVVGRPNMWVPNFIVACCSVVIIRLIGRDRALPAWKVWVVPVAVLAALVTIDAVWGAVAYGVATSVPQVIGAFAQFVDVVREVDIRGISPFFVVAAVVVQGLWWAWGYLVPEMAVFVSASANGAVALLTLLWYIARQLGAPPLWPQARTADAAHEVAGTPGVDAAV